MLSVVTKNFKSTILIIDNGNIMDLSFIDAYGSALSAALYVWNGGMESGNAVARVLSGKVNPSGRLPDTIAKRYNDYPSAKTSAGRNITIIRKTFTSAIAFLKRLTKPR